MPFQNYLKYLANCKVFISTSAWEGMPNILIEAVVLEKKIVATASGVWKILNKKLPKAGPGG